MDYSLSSEQQMFQKMFRDFAAREVAKVADQADKQEGVPAKLLKRMAAQGFLGAVCCPRSLTAAPGWISPPSACCWKRWPLSAPARP